VNVDEVRRFRRALAHLSEHEQALRDWMPREAVATEVGPVDDAKLDALIDSGVVRSSSLNGRVWVKRSSLYAAKTLLVVVVLWLLALIVTLVDAAACDWTSDNGVCPHDVLRWFSALVASLFAA